MKVNFKVRFKNKAFWVALIPALFLLLQQVLAIFGIEYDGTQLSEQLISIIGTLFAILALMGVVQDPTTKGVSDSDQALEYTEPK